MLDWLRKRLRAWLLGPEPVKDLLECYVRTPDGPRLVAYRITAANGLRLVGVPVSAPAGYKIKQGETLLRDSDTEDKQHFWLLWQKHNRLHLTWEGDNTPFEPPL